MEKYPVVQNGPARKLGKFTLENSWDFFLFNNNCENLVCFAKAK
jgi:hypothetical protein